MFYSNMRRLEKRIEQLEKTSVAKQEEQGIKILLDFNRDGEDDPNNVYLLATIPPKSQWKHH